MYMFNLFFTDDICLPVLFYEFNYEKYLYNSIFIIIMFPTCQVSEVSEALYRAFNQGDAPVLFFNERSS